MKIEIEIPADRIADLMVTAIEGNHMTRAWCAGIYLKNRADTGSDLEEPWYSDSNLYADEFEIEVHEIEDERKPDKVKKHKITRADFEAGLRIMAEKYGGHFGTFIEESEDASTADVFLQCVVLKEVVYG